MIKIKNIFSGVLFSMVLCGCASFQANPEMDNFLKSASQSLVGKSAEDIVTCAGLPDATVNLGKNKQVLTYINVTTRIDQDPLHAGYLACPYLAYDYRCGYSYARFGPLGHWGRSNITQKGCRVGIWTQAAKVTKVSYDMTSQRAKKHCARIVEACVAPVSTPKKDIKSGGN